LTLYFIEQNSSDLCFCPGFLSAKVVGREAEHDETTRLVTIIDLLQSAVLWCVAAPAGDIDDQHHLALVLVELDGLALDIPDRNLVDRSTVCGWRGRDCFAIGFGRWSSATPQSAAIDTSARIERRIPDISSLS
jgi:hypothetical protein